MWKLLLILFVTALTDSVFSQEQLVIRKKIIPLYSNRSDVEKLARFMEDSGGRIRYQTENEILDVYYSQTECVGHGWKVPANRVLSYLTYPKHSLLLEDVKKISRNLIEISDDSATKYFINASDGLEFVMRPGEQSIAYIGFSPSEADSSLRCSGFPKYDLVSQHYLLYQTFSVTNTSNWDVGEIYATLAEVEGNSNLKGYIFVYCKKGQLLKCEELIKKIKRVNSMVVKSKASGVKVTFGGYRSEIEVETFLVPKDYPPAIARPIFPSK